MKMAPVPAFPIPTAADQLPTKKFKLPPGFKAETWASGVLDAREIREGPKGTIVVSTLFVGNKVYAFPPGKHEPKVIIDKMPMAAGIAFDSKGNLYVATNTKVMRYDNVEDKLDNVGEPKVIYDKLPGGNDHSWKFLRIKDDKLYIPIGAPCNICDPGEYATIYRMNLDGTGMETLASGVRNTVGFDFDPKTGDDTLAPVQPPPSATPADPARMSRGQALAQQHKCVFCHGADLAGGQQVPRISGQREEYLRDSLRGFKSGTRPGYTMAMSEAVSQVSLEELDTLAYYAARFASPPVAGKWRERVPAWPGHGRR